MGLSCPQVHKISKLVNGLQTYEKSFYDANFPSRLKIATARSIEIVPSGGPPLEFINIQSLKRAPASRIHQSKGVRLYNFID
jgi:hypothetical protein